MDLKNLSYPHCCKYCKYSTTPAVSRESFCRFKNIVPASYVCKKYDFDPFKYKVSRIRSFKGTAFTAEDFKID